MLFPWLRNYTNSGNKADFVTMPDKLKWLLGYHFIRGDLSNCQKIIRYAFHTSADNLSITIFQGRIYQTEGNHQEALRLFQACYEKNPNDPENLRDIANCLLAQKRFTKAIEALTQALNLYQHPNFSVHFELATCYAVLKNHNLAERHCKEALGIHQSKAIYKLLTTCLIEQNKTSEALEVFRAALRNYPKSSALYAKFGKLCSRMQFEEEAFKTLTTSIKLNPENIEASLELAYLYQRKSQHVEAIDLYKKAILLGYESPCVFNNMGLSYFRKNRYVLALSCLLRARELSPATPEILFNIGLIYATLRQYCSAMIHWKASQACVDALKTHSDDELVSLIESCSVLLINKDTVKTSLNIK